MSCTPDKRLRGEKGPPSLDDMRAIRDEIGACVRAVLASLDQEASA